MKAEEKDLLLKDLCARLPYGVKAQYYGSEEEMLTVDTIEAIYIQPSVEIVIGQYGLGIEDIKPYLRPMSSMTEEEEKEYNLLANRCMCTTVGFIHLEAEPLLDWLNKKMFDFRGLIPKDLALSTEGFNPYKD
jgi:hypothetical protein